VRKLLPQVAAWDGPVFFRLCRNEVPVLFDESYEPRFGKAIRLRPGRDLTLIGTGIMVGRCLEAAEDLAREGTDAAVMEVHTVKPIDVASILGAARNTGAIVTAEEHSIIGGLGAAVAEVVTDVHPVPVKRCGIDDRFAESGPYLELLDNYGMSVADIIRAAHQALEMKKC
jgi:transketolase